MKPLESFAATLLVIGGLNWGLVGLLNFNLVTTLFGGFSRIVFILVGWSAVYLILNWNRIRRRPSA